MQLIKVLKKRATIEGLDKGVLVSIEIENEDVDFSFWDADLMKLTQKDIDKGLQYCLWVKVTARFSGLDHFEGHDSLGQVFVRSGAVEKDVLQTVEIHDMVKTSINDLIKNVLNGQNELNQFLGKAA